MLRSRTLGSGASRRWPLHPATERSEQSMNSVIDAYASRNEPVAAMRPQHDPVVYGRAGEPGLTEHELKSYQKKGFIFLKSLFSPHEVAVFLAEARRLAADPAIREREEAIREPDSDEIRSVFDAH